MKIALITGVSRGIGKALAEKFLENDYSVIGTSTEGASSLTHPKLKVFQLELTDSKSIEVCANQISQLGDKIDIFINNAGTWLPTDQGPSVDIPSLRKTLEINLIGPIDFTERLTPLINERGHIINISSRNGSLDYAHNAIDPAYKISKAGLNMFTRVLAFRFKDKITASCVHPGAVKTALAAPDADMDPEEAAEHIYKLAISKPETGQFWFKGEKFPW